MNSINRIDIKEFRAKGYLQEANRKFFHPLGLALEVIVNEETGEETLGGIWDFRNDPEGVLYGSGIINVDKAREIEVLRLKKVNARIQHGCNKDGIQPVNS
jgi:hypothetical protein